MIFMKFILLTFSYFEHLLIFPELFIMISLDVFVFYGKMQESTRSSKNNGWTTCAFLGMISWKHRWKPGSSDSTFLMYKHSKNVVNLNIWYFLNDLENFYVIAAHYQIK